MTDQHPKDTRPQPQGIPGVNLATGGVGAAILAAMAWIGQELLTLEKEVTSTKDKVDIGVANIEKTLSELDDDVDKLQDRMTLIEERQLRASDRTQNYSTPVTGPR